MVSTKYRPGAISGQLSATMKDFRKLAVWEKSHRLTMGIYRITQSFPKEENYGLTSQIRRASASIPTNIAEGCGRSTDVELARFCEIAMGSASEFEYQLFLASELTYTDPATYGMFEQDIVEIKRMLSALIIKLRRNKLNADRG
ncbi:MAG: four helix bundle protein [Verrucomicrobiota bacterium]|nr:four helix bundle protein [Verrucomicrobiota bacterium]